MRFWIELTLLVTSLFSIINIYNWDYKIQPILLKIWTWTNPSLRLGLRARLDGDIDHEHGDEHELGHARL